MSKTARQQRKHRYQSVLRTIDYQTSPKQPPGVRTATIKTILAGPWGRYGTDDLESALKAARQNGDIVRWRDGEGRIRVTCASEDDLQRLARHLAEEVEDPEQLGRINTRLQEVRDDGE